MDNLLSSTTWLNWGTLAALGALGLFYLLSRTRQNDMKILRDANQDLRDGMTDRDKKITSLETAVHTLEIKVESLEKRNKTLEDLVVVALKQYFFENPQVAKNLGDIIK